MDATQGPLVAHLGHGLMSDLSPLSGEERTSNFGAVRSVDDPIGDIGYAPRGNILMPKALLKNPLWAHFPRAFHRGLGENIEGHNVTIEYRWAPSENDLYHAGPQAAALQQKPRLRPKVRDRQPVF